MTYPLVHSCSAFILQFIFEMCTRLFQGIFVFLTLCFAHYFFAYVFVCMISTTMFFGGKFRDPEQTSGILRIYVSCTSFFPRAESQCSSFWFRLSQVS